MILSYIKFFSSYLVVAVIWIVAGMFNGNAYQDFIIWIMLSGSLIMIFSAIFLNIGNSCLRENSFYNIHLVWVAFLILIGVFLNYTEGFTNMSEYISESGVRSFVVSNSIYYDIFVFLSHAFIFSTLILVVSSIIFRKIKLIIKAISSLAIIIIYIVLTV